MPGRRGHDDDQAAARIWVIAFLSRVSLWADGWRPRTWLLHALIAVPMAACASGVMLVLWVLGEFNPLTAGVVTSMFFWALRDGEQVLHELMRGTPVDVVDHIMDVVAPAAVLIGGAVLLGPR